MTPTLLLRLTVRPTLEWLAGPIAGIPHTRTAERILVAIAVQETNLLHRRQVPVAHAMGWWQFERGGGVAGVLAHPATQQAARAVCNALRVEPVAGLVHPALEHNDALACAFARLLLRSDPRALPEDEAGGWQCYIRNWRPGKPHPHRWDTAWRAAEQALKQDA